MSMQHLSKIHLFLKLRGKKTATSGYSAIFHSDSEEHVFMSWSKSSSEDSKFNTQTPSAGDSRLNWSSMN